jgi:hypothetical protein
VVTGFHIACTDLRPHKRFVVYPGAERFPLGRAWKFAGQVGEILTASPKGLQAPPLPFRFYI